MLSSFYGSRLCFCFWKSCAKDCRYQGSDMGWLLSGQLSASRSKAGVSLAGNGGEEHPGPGRSRATVRVTLFLILPSCRPACYLSTHLPNCVPAVATTMTTPTTITTSTTPPQPSPLPATAITPTNSPAPNSRHRNRSCHRHRNCHNTHQRF